MAIIDVEVKSNIPEVEKYVREAVERALEAVGLQTDGYVSCYARRTLGC